MKVADKLERRVLGMARGVCLITFIGALLAIIALLFALLAGRPARAIVKDPPLSASEVLSMMPGSEAANDAISTSAAPQFDLPNASGLAVPTALRADLMQDSASQPVVNEWLNHVPVAYRQQFLNELSAVVVLAHTHASAWEWDDRQRYIAAAMNQYAQTKIARIVLTEKQIAAEDDLSDLYRSSLGVLLGVTGLLTLLLVLMSIERNTRRLRTDRGE